MARRTLGQSGANIASAAYVFLHYTLLVAYISRAGATVANTAGQPVWASAAVFTALLGGLCYAGSSRLLDILNTVLLALVVISFLCLVAAALPGVRLDNLEAASWPSVIDTLPVVALSFVYQNVIPVVVTNLEGDVQKVRVAVWAGLAVPLCMFVGWEAAMLGSIEPGTTCARARGGHAESMRVSDALGACAATSASAGRCARQRLDINCTSCGCGMLAVPRAAVVCPEIMNRVLNVEATGALVQGPAGEVLHCQTPNDVAASASVSIAPTTISGAAAQRSPPAYSNACFLMLHSARDLRSEADRGPVGRACCAL